MRARQGRGQGAGRVGLGGSLVGVVAREGCLSGRAVSGAGADSHQEDDADQAAPREDLGQPFPGREVAEEGEGEGLVPQLRVSRDQGEEQDREGNHDQPVGALDPRASLELAVGERGGEDAPQAPADRAQPSGVGRSRSDRAPHVREPARKRHDGQSAHQEGKPPHDGAKCRIGHVSSSWLLHPIVASRSPRDRVARRKARAIHARIAAEGARVVSATWTSPAERRKV